MKLKGSPYPWQVDQQSLIAKGVVLSENCFQEQLSARSYHQSIYQDNIVNTKSTTTRTTTTTEIQYLPWEIHQTI
jgi:hypothetical protein